MKWSKECLICKVDFINWSDPRIVWVARLILYIEVVQGMSELQGSFYKLNWSKECLSWKVDFINVTVWSKITLTRSHTDVLFARRTAVHCRLYSAYRVKIYCKWNNTQLISSRVTKMIKCSCSLLIKGESCWLHWN